MINRLMKIIAIKCSNFYTPQKVEYYCVCLYMSVYVGADTNERSRDSR